MPVYVAGDGVQKAGPVLPAGEGELAAPVGAGALLGGLPGPGGKAGAVPATYQDEGLLSLYMEARERRGDGRTLYGRSGDIWEAKTGAPVPVPWRGRRKLCQSLELREEGVLDPDFGEKLGRFFSGKNVCLRPEGLEVWFPQCTIAPAAEGLPTFLSKEVDFLKQTCYNLKK